MTLLVTDRPGDGAAWRTATGNLDRRWLGVMGDRPAGQFLCFTLQDDRGAEIACTTGYLVRDPGAYEAFNWHRLLWSRPGVFPEQPAETVPPPPAAACFPALNLVQPGYDFTVHTVTADAGGTTERLLTEIDRWARDNGLAAVAALYASDELRPVFDELGWMRFRGADRAVLTTKGEPTFLHFTTALSRNTRKQIRADGKVLAANEVSVHRTRFSAHLTDLLPLRADLVRKYGSYADPRADAARADKLLGVYGEDGLRLFTAQDPDGLILGFALFVVTAADTWTSFWVGSRRDDPRSDRVYFACLFYAALTEALPAGITSVDYGLGTDPAKLRRGCQARQRDVVVAPIPRAGIDRSHFEGARRIRPSSASIR
jgi:uncharacterized protein